MSYVYLVDVTRSTDRTWLVFLHRSDGSVELVQDHLFRWSANRRARQLAEEALDVQGPNLRLEVQLAGSEPIIYGQDPRTTRRES